MPALAKAVMLALATLMGGLVACSATPSPPTASPAQQQFDVGCRGPDKATYCC